MDLFILFGSVIVLLFCVIGIITKRFNDLEDNLKEDLKEILQNTCSHEKTDIVNAGWNCGYEEVCEICSKTLRDVDSEEYCLYRVKQHLKGTGYKPVKIKKEIK